MRNLPRTRSVLRPFREQNRAVCLRQQHRRRHGRGRVNGKVEVRRQLTTLLCIP